MILPLLLPLFSSLPASAAEAPALKTEAQSVSLSLDGSFERYDGSLSDELRTGLEFGCASELKLAGSALDWDLELYYDHSRNKGTDEASRADSLGLDLAKLMLDRWHGKELKAFKPYLLAGAELTWLEKTDSQNGASRSVFLSPAAGIGTEFRLTRRASLQAEYRSTLTSGARRMSSLTLGLAYDIFGSDGEED